MALDPVTGIINLVTTGIDKIFPDADEKQKGELSSFLATLQGQVQVLMTEMQGNWLQKSWRPILMLSIVAIVVNNYILVPYLGLFGLPVVTLDLPEKLWNLMTLGVGGYIAGRSGEKIVEAWKK